MALRIELFDGTKTYMFVNGEIATPEKIRAHFPAVDMFPHILEINGDVIQAVMNLNAMREMHKVDPLCTHGEACTCIQDIINTPPPPAPISPEERLAAAAEFSNIMLLDTPVLTIESPLESGEKEITIITKTKTIEEDPHAKIIKQNFDRGLWNKAMIDKAMEKGVLTVDQHNEIITIK